MKLKENIKYKDLDINELIDGWLNDDTNWKQYTPVYSPVLFSIILT